MVTAAPVAAVREQCQTLVSIHEQTLRCCRLLVELVVQAQLAREEPVPGIAAVGVEKAAAGEVVLAALESEPAAEPSFPLPVVVAGLAGCSRQ